MAEVKRFVKRPDQWKQLPDNLLPPPPASVQEDRANQPKGAPTGCACFVWTQRLPSSFLWTMPGR